MKKILILLQVVVFITLTNCGGYKSIYSSKTYDFNVVSIEIDENNEINSKVKNSRCLDLSWGDYSTYQ